MHDGGGGFSGHHGGGGGFGGHHHHGGGANGHHHRHDAGSDSGVGWTVLGSARSGRRNRPRGRMSVATFVLGMVVFVMIITMLALHS